MNSFLWLDRHASLAMRKIGTIYFGWGTPSVLSHSELESILECFPDYRSASELTLESNPEDITEDYVRRLFDLGITRLSMWVQTLNDVSLKEIHRSSKKRILEALESIHTVIATKEAIQNFSTHVITTKIEIESIEQDFSSLRSLEMTETTRSDSSHYRWQKLSINIDFILGLPYTLPGETLRGMQELHKKFPFITHTSVYMLEDEKYPKHWKTNSITEVEMQKEFLDIMEYFDSIGWHHYELSNFAKPWYESKHNQSYWDYSPYRGFGLSASSFEWEKRWTNSSSFAGYYKWERDSKETLTQEAIQIEEIMFSMRRDGVDLKLLEEKKYTPHITEWLLEIRGTKIFPTKTWIFLLDHIIGELI